MSHDHLLRRWTGAFVGQLAVGGADAFHRWTRRAAAAIDRAEAASGMSRTPGKRIGRKR